jgi:hypothetical protein
MYHRRTYISGEAGLNRVLATEVIIYLCISVVLIYIYMLVISGEADLNREVAKEVII